MVTTNYTTEQFDANYPIGLENFYWTKARNFLLYKKLKQLGITDAILEIGCGRGIVVKYLNQHGMECKGVELSNVQTVEGIAPHQIIIGQDALNMPIYFREHFTTLLLLDVIEHIEQPIEFVQSILNKYPNLKNIIITVPARQEIWSNYDEFFGHYRRYDLKTLHDTLTAAGITVIQNQYFFHSLYFPALLFNKLSLKRNVQVKAPKGKMIHVHKLLAWLFVAEYYLLPKSFIGSSIFAMGKK